LQQGLVDLEDQRLAVPVVPIFSKTKWRPETTAGDFWAFRVNPCEAAGTISKHWDEHFE
jgi:hypothetical protein